MILGKQAVRKEEGGGQKKQLDGQASLQWKEDGTRKVLGRACAERVGGRTGRYAALKNRA